MIKNSPKQTGCTQYQYFIKPCGNDFTILLQINIHKNTNINQSVPLLSSVYSFKSFLPVLVAVVVALLPSRVSSIKGSPSLNEISVLRTVVSVLKRLYVILAVFHFFMKILLYGVKSILVDFDNINRNNRAGKSSSYHPYTQSLQKLIKLNRKSVFIFYNTEI